MELYIESGTTGGKPRKRRAEYASCEHCSSEFKRIVQKDPKKFCNHDCYKKSIRVKFKCDNCKVDVWRTPRSIKKSKNKIFFCGKKCANIGFSIHGNPKLWKKGCCIERGEYTTRLFKKYHDNFICEGCKEPEEYLLQVHHKDGNRDYNVKSNFEVVCGNCHIKRHLKKNKNNEWVFDPSVITPRHLLKDL